MRVDLERGVVLLAGRLHTINPTRHEKGYVRVQLGRRHPWANKAGQQYLHRIAMFEHLGRRLSTYEHVHHENGDKETHRVEDLAVFEDVDHGHFHRGQRLGCGREFATVERGVERQPSEPRPAYYPHV